MKSDSSTLENIINQFKEKDAINQIKNIEKQIIIFDLREKDKEIDINDSQIIKGNEQIIFSIISNQLKEKINYLLDPKTNNFNFELFIYILIEQIKQIISLIYKSTKIIVPEFFKEMNKNIIKKKQSLIINFLLSFYDNINNDNIELNLEQINILINKEDTFFISCAKIILVLNKYIDKNKIKGIFGEIKSKENKKLINKIILYLISIFNTFILIKQKKKAFKINENIKNFVDYNIFDILLEKTYENNMPSLIILLFDIIFKYDLITFFQIIINNDDINKILLNRFGYEFKIRYRFIELLFNSPSVLGENEQKELLKILKENDTIINLFNYIINDINNKKYKEDKDFIKLFNELKILYFFSIKIDSKDENIEKIIIKILLKISNNDNYKLDDKIFGNFVNDLFKLRKKISKHKYKLYNFIILLAENITNYRIIILKIFFSNIKGNLDLFLELIEKIDSFKLLLNNLYKYQEEIITIIFDFFESLKEKNYFPLNELNILIQQIPFFNNISTAKIFIQNLNSFINKKKGNNNSIDSIIDTLSLDESLISLKKEEKNNSFIEIKNKIYENYLNILYNTIIEIKDNINSFESKSPFDIDVSLSSIININYSNDSQKIKKNYLSINIILIFIEYLSSILDDQKIFELFISKRFLDFFPYLINDEKYKIIPYKLIKIFLESNANNINYKEKNKEQILNILNRCDVFPIIGDNNEIRILKEILIMMDTIKILFSKKSLVINDIIKKIIDFYSFYSEYINSNYNKCSEQYNNEYHILIKNYLDIIIELIKISNKNIILKNNDSIIIKEKYIKIIFGNIIKFYIQLTKDNIDNNKYFLNIIKYFIDKSINLYLSSSNVDDINNNILEKDFSIYYIKKFKINIEIIKENNEIRNKSIISNICIQSPLIILILLKILFKYNKYEKQFLEFIYFLCKINYQNIIFLLKHDFLKTLFQFLEEKPIYNDIIIKILESSFKFFDNKNFSYIFTQIINLLNKSEENKNYNNIIKDIFKSLNRSIKIINNSKNGYYKGIILSENKIEQPNIYNMLEIKNIEIPINKNNIYIRQEISFYKSLQTRKLLLLRISNCKMNSYIEVSFRKQEIVISESDGKMKYEDLSDYNSIFIDDDLDLKSKKEHNLKINENNIISYLFKIDKNILIIYINGNKIFSYEYKYKFGDIINIEIGYPLDLINEYKDNNKFILYNHIKLKSFEIISHNENDIENIYKLNTENISFNYLFIEELTNFKLDENTFLISKYNNINSVKLNSILRPNYINNQLYNSIFFNQVLSTQSLNYLFRLEKYIIILLNNSNIDKNIFDELIQLLCIYLIMNKTFIHKYFAKEEFSSSFYFSLYKNAKFIDKYIIEYLFSIIFVDNNINIIAKYIIDILFDIRIFEMINNQTKIDLISIINKNIIEKEKNIINIFYIFEKLQKILLLCFFNNKIMDELIINIILKSLEENPKEKQIVNLVEEIIYILFHFPKYNTEHISKFKKGKNEETIKIISEYFYKIYNNENLIFLKNFILQKFQKINIDPEIANKINRLINAYSPPNIIDSSKNKIFNFDNNDDEDISTLFDLDKNIKIKRSYSFKKDKITFQFKSESKGFLERNFNKKLTMNSQVFEQKLKIKKENKIIYNEFPLKYDQIREPSFRPLDDNIIFKGIINGNKRKSYNIFKSKKDKKKIEIDINITEQDKEKCNNNDCHLCKFIEKILLSLFKTEKKYEIYKNYLLHILSEIFILNQNNKKLDLKFDFSYYLIKREGPNRIRKKFNIRIDKLLNKEYDREDIKNKKEEKNEYWKLFDFYEDKKNGKYINNNLLQFFNLGQIFNINIVKYLIDEDDEYQESFNCLLFKGLSYINSVIILGIKKIYILSRVLLSSENILYDSHYPISKKFWILNRYEDILSEQCEYLNSYENINNIDNKGKNKQRKKKIFEKAEKGFWIYTFYYAEINEIHKRKFLHQKNAIEIFLKNGKNYYIAFNLNKRDKIIKLIINNIKLSHSSINNSFIINNEYNSLEELQENENQKENKNNIFEIQNETLIKNDNMIFIKNVSLFLQNSKKYKRNNFIENIFKKQKKTKINLGTILDSKSILQKSYEQWTSGHISTYSYLMILNTLSGRTYNDLAQYPIYPWILSDYCSEEIDFNNSNIYRDFNYPIYAQNEQARDNLELKYENFDDLSGFKYHSGSHYSNAGFVCYYLIRIKPFSISTAEIQGEYFDTTDRLFYNIGNLWKVNEKYQELIPDIFNIPEIFININKFIFGLNSEKKIIDNVIIPLWGKHSPRIFCKILKKSLESKYVSININNWIDLIFGYKQNGKNAEKYYNILRDVCSKFNPEKDCEDEKELEQKINEICEMGINPIQLFTKPHPKREKHEKIKAFFYKNIYLQYFKAKENIDKINNNEYDNIKEMKQYYENEFGYFSRGEGGLSSFRILYEEDDEKFNENNANKSIYFIISGKKCLIPPSYKNFIQWDNNNSFFLVKYFKNIKYKFCIKHMWKYKIKLIKITKDGDYLIIGYNNGIIEKYKLIRIRGPKNKAEKDKMRTSDKILKDKNYKNKIDNKENEKNNSKEGLYNILFGSRNKKQLPNNQFYKNINLNNKKEEDNEEENINILKDIQYKKSIKNNLISNKISFDSKFPISTSNIINSDCIIINNNTGKFIQYSGCELENEEEILGYDIYYQNKNNNKNVFTTDKNINNSIEKNYIIFLVNSLNQILNEISMIEICESYSFILIIDKINNLYIIDFNTFDLLKKIDCNIYFEENIKFISICPDTGDFILATYHQLILMSINGVLITKINNVKSKIKYCFITSLSNSDLYLFTAHENGNLMISILVNNNNGIFFGVSKSENNLLNSRTINELNNKYEPIKIQNASKAYYISYNTGKNNDITMKDYIKFIKDENNFLFIFDTLTEIKCSEFALKYIKLTQNSSNLICIDIKNNIINLNYEEFFISKKKFNDKKNIIYCNKCNNPISSSKIICQICGKKLCSNCKMEIIIPDISLKNTKPVCDECFQLINKSNQSLYDF